MKHKVWVIRMQAQWDRDRSSGQSLAGRKMMTTHRRTTESSAKSQRSDSSVKDERSRQGLLWKRARRCSSEKPAQGCSTVHKALGSEFKLSQKQKLLRWPDSWGGLWSERQLWAPGFILCWTRACLQLVTPKREFRKTLVKLHLMQDRDRWAQEPGRARKLILILQKYSTSLTLSATFPLNSIWRKKTKNKKQKLTGFRHRASCTFKIRAISVSVGNSQLCRVAKGKGYTHPEITTVISIETAVPPEPVRLA